MDSKKGAGRLKNTWSVVCMRVQNGERIDPENNTPRDLQCGRAR